MCNNPEYQKVSKDHKGFILLVQPDHPKYEHQKVNLLDRSSTPISLGPRKPKRPIWLVFDATGPRPRAAVLGNGVIRGKRFDAS